MNDYAVRVMLDRGGNKELGIFDSLDAVVACLEAVKFRHSVCYVFRNNEVFPLAVAENGELYFKKSVTF